MGRLAVCFSNVSTTAEEARRDFAGRALQLNNSIDALPKTSITHVCR